MTTVRNYRHIEVRPVAGALGAEIAGVDMARDLDSDVVAEVRQALLDHLVIFLREQTVTPQQQLAFARKFGDPVEYPQLKGLPETPMITPVVKLEHERNNFGGIWHSDTTYLERPPMGSLPARWMRAICASTRAASKVAPASPRPAPTSTTTSFSSASRSCFS